MEIKKISNLAWFLACNSLPDIPMELDYQFKDWSIDAFKESWKNIRTPEPAGKGRLRLFSPYRIKTDLRPGICLTIAVGFSATGIFDVYQNSDELFCVLRKAPSDFENGLLLDIINISTKVISLSIEAGQELAIIQMKGQDNFRDVYGVSLTKNNLEDMIQIPGIYETMPNREQYERFYMLFHEKEQGGTYKIMYRLGSQIVPIRDAVIITISAKGLLPSDDFIPIKNSTYRRYNATPKCQLRSIP